MPWVKLDDRFPDHPKVLQAGPVASWMYVCGLAYCARYLTDGFIPAVQVRRLADVKNADQLAAALVRVGLWESADGGYRVHDYHEYQPSADKVTTERAKARDRMGRRRSPEQGAPLSPEQPTNNGRSSGEQPTNNGRSSGEQPANMEGSSPSPYPSRTHKEAKASSVPNGTVSEPDEVDEVFAYYRDKIQPHVRLNPRKKIEARLKRFSADELRQGIDHFSADPWWMENNGDRGASWFFESDAKSEQFLLLKPRTRQPAGLNGTHSNNGKGASAATLAYIEQQRASQRRTS